MSTIRISKEFRYEMAHALFGYDGKCANVHGHSYKLTVTVIGQPLEDTNHPKNGMVMDYGDLKDIVKEEIIDQVDHAVLLNANSPHADLAKLPHGFDKAVLVPYQPTCEKMIEDFAERIKKRLPSNVKLNYLRLRETGTSFTEWFAEDN